MIEIINYEILSRKLSTWLMNIGKTSVCYMETRSKCNKKKDFTECNCIRFAGAREKTIY